MSYYPLRSTSLLHSVVAGQASWWWSWGAWTRWRRPSWSGSPWWWCRWSRKTFQTDWTLPHNGIANPQARKLVTVLIGLELLNIFHFRVLTINGIDNSSIFNSCAVHTECQNQKSLYTIQNNYHIVPTLLIQAGHQPRDTRTPLFIWAFTWPTDPR